MGYFLSGTIAKPYVWFTKPGCIHCSLFISLSSLSCLSVSLYDVCLSLSLCVGRDEIYWDKFVVSPDNQYLVFLGKNGYMILVSNKVHPSCGVN